jgi:hypothetical protein
LRSAVFINAHGLVVIMGGLSVPSLEIRPYTPADYPQIRAIWAARGFQELPPAALPLRGRIACIGDRLIAFGFLYTSDSAISWLEWITTNPAHTPDARNNALDLIINSLLDAARQAGAALVFTSLADRGLMRRYQAHGFQQTDTEMTNFIKVL